MAIFHGRASNMLLRDVQINRREWWSNQQWGQTVAVFSDNAGGRVYNLAFDFHESSGTPLGTHHVSDREHLSSARDLPTEQRRRCQRPASADHQREERRLVRSSNAKTLRATGCSWTSPPVRTTSPSSAALAIIRAASHSSGSTTRPTSPWPALPVRCGVRPEPRRGWRHPCRIDQEDHDFQAGRRQAFRRAQSAAVPLSGT